MKRILALALVAILVYSCTNGQTNNIKIKLSPTEFASKLKEFPSAVLLDVRTPDEFSKGHIAKSTNYDWNEAEFDRQIANLDKEKPVFVYCLSGGRSASAANKMHLKGFKTVYELEGGMMKWRSANLPETTKNTLIKSGMTRKEFDVLINSKKLILIDFYADWCAPCKKMEPYLTEISTDMAQKVTVIRINADDNPELCKELKIDALPVLQLYKNKSLIWTNTGLIEKAAVVKQLH